MMAQIHVFRNGLRDWLRALPSCSTASRRGNRAFTADVSGLCVQLPLRLVSYSLYGKELVDEVWSKPQSQFDTLAHPGQNFAELEKLACVREQLSTYVFFSQGMISKLYSYLPTQANRLLNDFTKQFRAFNLRMVAIAEEVCHSTTILDLKSFTHFYR